MLLYSDDDESVTDQEQNGNDKVKKQESPRMREQISETNESPNEDNEDSTDELPEGEQHYPLYVARFDYSNTAPDMLSFTRGEFLFVVNDKEDWWYAKTRYPGVEGYVPSNFLKRYATLDAYRLV